MDINYFKKINNTFNTAYKKDAKVYQIKRAIENKFEDNLFTYQVKINGNPVFVIINSSTRNNRKTIISRPSESFKDGDLVVWGDDTWIITECDPREDIYSKGLLLLCNSTLKWLDKQGKIKEVPFAITNDNLTNFGVDFGRLISLPDERRNIVIPSNPDTDMIDKNDRFIFDERAWKVTAINKLNTGLNYMTLNEDLIDESTDNLTLRIANYFNNKQEVSLKILNKPESGVISIEENQSLKLNIELKNKGKLLDSSLVSFRISDTDVALITEDMVLTPLKKGTVIVTVEYENVTDFIQVNIADSIINNFNAIIYGDSDIKYNMTKLYSCTFTENGIPKDDESYFWLTGEDGLSTSLAQITEQDSKLKTCKIKAGNKKGLVILHVENLTKLAHSELRIEIKSLI